MATPPTAPARARRRSAAPLDFILAEGLIHPDQLVLVSRAEEDERQARQHRRTPRPDVRGADDARAVAALPDPSVKFPESISAEVLRLVPGAIARKHQVLPIGRSAAR